MPKNGTIDSCKLVQTIPAADHWIQGLVVSKPDGMRGMWEQRLEAGEGGMEVLKEWRRAAFAPLSWDLEKWAVFLNQLLIRILLFFVMSHPDASSWKDRHPSCWGYKVGWLHPPQDYSLGSISVHAHPMGAATWSALQFLPPFALRCPPLPSTGINPKASP